MKNEKNNSSMKNSLAQGQIFSASKGLFLLFASILTGILGIGLFNFLVDAQCTFGCNSVKVERDSLNPFFQKAKQISNFDNLETLIVGSSRGESTSSTWYSQAGFGSTLNVSIAGAEAFAKATLIDLALEKRTLKNIIWLADDFDLQGQVIDAKIENLKALERFFPTDFKTKQKNKWQRVITQIQYLIDHKSFEASLKYLTQKEKVRNLALKKVGEEFSLEYCESIGKPAENEELLLDKNIQLIFQNYVNGPLRYETPVENWKWFQSKVNSWNEMGLKIYLVINPFHYKFLSRLEKENAVLFEKHQNWTQKIKLLQGPLIHVVSLEELESEESPQDSLFWSDGVHYTCRIASKIFRIIEKKNNSSRSKFF